MSDADMIVYFDVMALRPSVARSRYDDGETAEGVLKVVAVGYDGTPGPKLTDADKARLVTWFNDHQTEALEIAEEWAEDCR